MRNFHGGMARRHFFEGWYVKQQSERDTVALIPAFAVDSRGGRGASIQAVVNGQTRTFAFQAGDCLFAPRHFFVKIGNNVFCQEGFSVDLRADGFSLTGSLAFSEWTPPSRNVMGPFRYVPLMQCNHGVLSFSHALRGALRFNGQDIVFDGGDGYIEKDWGRSFPKTYVWTQCSWRAKGGPCCVMVSVAEIPFGLHNFTGVIACVRCGDREYRFATYTGAKAVCFGRRTIIAEGPYHLEITLLEDKPLRLWAPQDGHMTRIIEESPRCRVRYRLTRWGRPVFDVTSDSASFEYAAGKEKPSGCEEPNGRR